MLISYKWLCELTGFNPGIKELEKRLTFCGLEVASIKHRGPEFENIIIGQIVEKKEHETKKNLNVLKVDNGKETLNIVCAAPNCPGPGSFVILAQTGAKIGEIVISPRKLAGVESCGMLCSEKELDIGFEDEGIIILDNLKLKTGTAIVEALDLEDWIFELEITPNRPDALCHNGLAREVCVLFNKEYNPASNLGIKESAIKAENTIKIENLAPKDAPRYCAAIINDIKVEKSPFSTRYRLYNLGIRPISNIVDITNLILMQFGQPLHAFDLDTIDKTIIIRNASTGEKINTLDQEERTLCETDLVICDSKGPIALAGVLGGLESEVTKKTKNILLECAYFLGSSIRKTAKFHKIHSESSYRFERGIDPNQSENVINTTCQMIENLSGGTKQAGFIDCYPKIIEPIKTIFRKSRYESIMGTTITDEAVEQILKGIGAEFEKKQARLEVSIPTFRPDMQREIDLIEEVARISGMDSIKPVLPKIQCQKPLRKEFDRARKAKEILISAGLQESITYSFVQKNLQELFFQKNPTVEISNPLSSNRASMRLTLLCGLLENLKRARSRYMDSFAQFEVGSVFFPSSNELPDEQVKIAAIVAGALPSFALDPKRNYDYFDIAGIAQTLCNKTGVTPVFEPTNQYLHMHPKRACNIICNKQIIGHVGQLHPALLKSFKLEKEVFCFEIDLNALYQAQEKDSAVLLSEYPPMVRDVAFLVDIEMPSGHIKEQLQNNCTPLAQEIKLFDIYQGQNIPENKKSLAFSIQYRSFEKTLTDEEVDKIHEDAVNQTCQTLSISRR